MQLAISFVIGRLAKIADINSTNVESSLIERSVRIRDVALRRDPLNALLPFPIESGHIVDLRVEIPWPTTSEPIRVRLSGICVALSPNFTDGGAGMSLEEIRNSITDEAILGPHAPPEKWTRGADGMSLNGDPPGEEALLEQCKQAHEPSRSASEADDEDYLSCRSEGDASLSASLTAHPETAMPAQPEESTGVFSFFRNVAAKSVSWIMRRPIELEIEDVKIMLPCDPEKSSFIEVHVEKLMVHVEPAKESGAERMKIVSVKIFGVTVSAQSTNMRKDVVQVKSCGVRLTSVFGANDQLCRENKAIEIDGAVLLFMDEETLQALGCCITNHGNMTNIPKYCRPFLSLRSQKSRWPYAQNCVLAQIRDRKRRFNFNPSHLHFYAEARKSYIRLLNDAHCTRDVSEKRESLAEVEKDLLYRDVVMFLREHVQKKYTNESTMNETLQPGIAHHVQGNDNASNSSLHIDVKLIQISFSAAAMVWIRDISFVSRFKEQHFSVGSLTVDNEGKTQILCGICESENLLFVDVSEKNDMLFLQVKVEEVRLALESASLLRIAQPFAEMALCVLPHLLPFFWKSKSSSSAVSRRISRTISLVLPLVQISIDNLIFTTERLSLNYIVHDGIVSRWGTLLKEFSVRYANDSEVISPINVGMGSNDDVICSEVSVYISNTLWDYFCRVRHEWENVIMILQSIMMNIGTWNNGTESLGKEKESETNASLITFDAMEKSSHMRHTPETSPKYQRMHLSRITCNVCPFQAKINIQSLDVSRVTCEGQQVAIRVGISLFHFSTTFVDGVTFTATLPNGLFCLLPLSAKEDLRKVTVCVHSFDINWAATTGVKETLGILKGSQGKFVIYGDTMYGVLDNAVILDAVEVAPVRIMYRRHCVGAPTTLRPYLASFMQVYINLARVHVERLAHLHLEPLIVFFKHCVALIVERVISQHAYRLFFSGLSDLALVVTAMPCEIVFGDAGSIFLQVKMPFESGKEALLESFGVFLPEVKEFGPLLVQNVCETLNTMITLPILELEASHSSFSLIKLRMVIRSLASTLPMCVQEFWETPVLAMQKSVLDADIQNVTFSLNGDLAILEDISLRYNMSNTSLLSRGVSNGSRSGSVERGISISALIDSDLESDVSSVIPSEEMIQLEVAGWNIYFRPLPEASLIHSFLMLYHELRFMFDSIFKKTLVISESVFKQNFMLSETGPCFFDRPGDVILIEDCSFLSTSPSNLRLVVCRETRVCFRRCRFSTSLQNAVCAEDRSAFFVIEEDCAEVEPAASLDVRPLTKTDDGRPLLRRICLKLQHGNIHIILGGKHSCRALLSFPSIELHMRTLPQKYIIQLRIQRSRCDIIEDGVISYLFTRTEVDIDAGVNMKKNHATLNAAVRITSVSIPLSFLELVRSIQDMCSEVVLLGKPACGRLYNLPRAPGEQWGFLFMKWKAFISFSVIPLEIRLLSGVPFVKLLIANTAIWSKSANTGEALMEVRVGLQEFTVLEFLSQTHVPFLRLPFSAIAVLRTKDFTSLSCDISLSSCELSLSSDQIKCALSIYKVARSETDMMLRIKEDLKRGSSVNLVNLTGAPLLLRESTTEEVELHNQMFLHRKMLSFPHCLHKINAYNVVDVEDSSCPFFNDPEFTTLLHAAYTAVLEDGDRVHMVTEVKEGSLMKVVTFRSVFHIMNSLSCCVKFYLKNENRPLVVIKPGELSCIPLAYMDSENIVMCLKGTDTDANSQCEPLGHGSPRSLLKEARRHGDETVGMIKTFLFEEAGNSCYVEVMYRLVDSILTMTLAPATPVIHNGTQFPLKVLLFVSEKLMEEKTINPNEVFSQISYDPLGLPLQFSFECVIHGETFFSHEKMDLRGIDLGECGSLVMKHSSCPGLYFFELSAERDSSRLIIPRLFYSVRPRYVFGIENNASLDVEIISEDGDSIGSLGGKVLSSSPGQNFAYLPFKTFMTLKMGTFRSAPFEVREKSSEGRLIVCDANNSEESLGNSHCFVLRPIEGCGAGYNMELVPAVFFYNMCKSGNLLVRHTVQPKESSGGSCGGEKGTWINYAVVQANERLPYTVSSRFGYTDFLSFAWNCDNSEEVVYSIPVEVAMSSKIDWTGFIQCGETHHALRIHRKGLGDPVIIIVGPPREPYVALVNLTPKSYDTLPPMAVISYTPPSVNNDEVVLSLGEEELRISINQDTCMALKNGMSVFVQAHRDSVTIVLVHVPLEKTSYKHIKMLNGVIPQKSFDVESILFSVMSSWRVDLKFFGLSFDIRDTHENAVHLGIENGEFWLVSQSSKITAQCTISNACIKNTYSGKTSHILRPFCVDMGIRDLEWTDNVVHIRSTQINFTRLVLEVSDVFLFQLQQLYKYCEFPVVNKTNNSLVDMNQTSAPIMKHRRLELESSAIFEACIVLTWDRSVAPPEDVVFRGSPIGSLVPSLHCATMTLPTLRFSDLSCNSVLEAISVVREVLTVEVLKQLPKLVTSVIVFTSLSPIGSLMNRVGSLIFGNKS